MDWFQIITAGIIGLVFGCFIGFGISLYQTETIIRSYRKLEAEAQDGFPFQ